MRLSQVVLSTLRGAAGAAIVPLVLAVGCTEPAPAAPPITPERTSTVATPAPAPVPAPVANPPAPAPPAVPEPAPPPTPATTDDTNAAPTADEEDPPEGTEVLAGDRPSKNRRRRGNASPVTGTIVDDPNATLEGSIGIGNLGTDHFDRAHAGCGRG